MAEDFGEIDDVPSIGVIRNDGKVTEKDVFRLAVGILCVCTVLYIGIVYIRFCYETTGSKEIWEHGKVFLSSTITLILGLYFGKKSSS